MDDLKGLTEELGSARLLGMYKGMLTIRLFEERVRYLFVEGIMPGTIHQYDGQEACAVGVCEALLEGDIIGSTHRPHGHAIARGITLKAAMAELFGKKTGCCKGKGGSMHLGDLSKGMFPAVAIVGGNAPIVTGIALSFKMQKKPNVAVSFVGDGGTNEGAFHEAVNMASAFGLPALFVIENNHYGASTRINLVSNVDDLSVRSAAYGIEGMSVFGNNILEVYAAAKRLIEKARKGGGPSILELKTFRRCGHSRRDARLYITKEDSDNWMPQDPIMIFTKVLLENGISDQESLDKISRAVESEIDEAVEYAKTSPDPAPEDVFADFLV
jgi:pyruvate dehydrogenase E1 component alpha subunit